MRTEALPRGTGEPSPPFAEVAVIGLGLMGGSLARALRALAAPPAVVGFSPSDRAAGALDRAAGSASDAAGAADLVVYATPLGALLELLDEHKDVWRPGAVITDLAGLKAPVAARARELGLERRYVGAHPMAGGEGSGFEASHADLFRGAPVWLAGDGVVEPAIRGRVERFWTSLGAITAWTDPVGHDLRMIRASHLPQLVSNALARVLEEGGLTPADLGPGGRDMTRLARSSPSMWRDLLEPSAPFIAEALREMATVLAALASRLEAEDVEGVASVMERTRRWAGGPARAEEPADGGSAPAAVEGT